MRNCFQFEGMSMLDHGYDVHKYFIDLYNHLFNGSVLEFEWKLPEWIYCPKIKEELFNFEILKAYQIYHDCGKPLCLTIDENGKRHFPNHAEISKQVWLENSNGSPEALQIAELIGMDMEIHTIKDEETIKQFCKKKEAISLLITGLCEIHSNAQMFGGIESTSFKIKWKQINKIGKKITGV